MLMKKNILILILIFKSILSVFSINNYNYDLITIIPIGTENGALGFNKKAIEVAGIVHPMSFSISNDMYFFISDPVNKRIVIYNPNLNFKKNINWKVAGGITHKMLITEKKEIIIYIVYQGLFLIKTEQNKIDRIFDTWFRFDDLGINNYFYMDNYIIYYDINKNIKFATKEGKLFTVEESLNLLETINIIKSETNKNIDPFLKDKKNFFKNKKIAIIGDKILSTSYNVHNKYYTAIKEEAENINRNVKSEVILPDKIYNRIFINYDENNNSYWYFDLPEEKRIIVVLDKYGNILDAFLTLNNAIYDIAFNGDVYILETDIAEVEANKGYKLYKVENNW